MMTTNYKIYDESDNYYGSFDEHSDAVDFAQEMADDLNIDMFIYEINKELLKCVIPNQ
ncbi:hypothetical protein ACQKNX_07530 [Lysinibacillus sp. NPDC093712]|uniref:hypothetical protein n=1 Tax=Lysinibacillus sp. NPDC093712 TaxID=3390579 RepID=UPI003CFF9FD5